MLQWTESGRYGSLRPTTLAFKSTAATFGAEQNIGTVVVQRQSGEDLNATQASDIQNIHMTFVQQVLTYLGSQLCTLNDLLKFGNVLHPF